MNKLLFISVLIVSCRYSASAQMKGDTIRITPCRCWTTLGPSVYDKWRYEQDSRLSETANLLFYIELLDAKIDSLEHQLNLKDSLYKFNVSMENYLRQKSDARIDSLERRPYLFIDNKGVRPGFWLTNNTGEYSYFVGPFR